MAVIIFIDITRKSRSLISKFKDEGHFAKKEVPLVNDVTNECTDSPGEKVLIWHVSSSKIRIGNEIQDVSLRNISNAIEILNHCQFKHKFGVTDNDEHYKQKVREAWNFDDVESWDTLKDRFKEGLKKGLKCQEKVIKSITNQIHYLFLPLDIDMQALKTTENAEAYLNDMYAGLEGLYKLDKYNGRNKNEHYRRKLFSLWRLLGDSLESNQIPLNKPNNDLLKLAGLENGNRKESPIYKFLESLDVRKTEAINYFLAPFESSGLKGCDGKEIKSFHNWYCALASCLRGAEGCEGN